MPIVNGIITDFFLLFISGNKLKGRMKVKKKYAGLIHPAYI
jgi:hypothetical protein